VYRIITYPEAADQIAALPEPALADYARTLDAIGVRRP